MSEEKLKPCPFCGGEAEIVRDVGSIWDVSCKRCYASIGAYHSYSKEAAIYAWNRRWQNIRTGMRVISFDLEEEYKNGRK